MIALRLNSMFFSLTASVFLSAFSSSPLLAALISERQHGCRQNRYKCHCTSSGILFAQSLIIHLQRKSRTWEESKISPHFDDLPHTLQCIYVFALLRSLQLNISPRNLQQQTNHGKHRAGHPPWLYDASNKKLWHLPAKRGKENVCWPWQNERPNERLLALAPSVPEWPRFDLKRNMQLLFYFIFLFFFFLFCCFPNDPSALASGPINAGEGN